MDNYDGYIKKNLRTLFDDDKIACQVRYYMFGIPYTVDGFIVDQTSHEVKFTKSYRHYIKGSIEKYL